jgi:hypothetical protein
LQRNEYTRYQRYISRRLGKVCVLTGTASLFRTYALKLSPTHAANSFLATRGRCTTRWR